MELNRKNLYMVEKILQKYPDVLLIIDKIEKILDRDKEDFVEVLEYLTEHCNQIKIITTSEKEISHQFENIKEHVIPIKPLTINYSVSFFI